MPFKRKISPGPHLHACSGCGIDLLRELHKIRQITASNPNDIMCRQATIMLNSLYKEIARYADA